MGEGEMRRIADWIGDILERPTDEALRARIRGEVTELTRSFPLYPELAAVGA
jgi:glycine/serine hydroxymethyltransferase